MLYFFHSDTFNFTMGSRNAINSNTERESNFNINPDRVNEDDIINNGCNRTDVKFNHYIIPVNTNAKDKGILNVLSEV